MYLHNTGGLVYNRNLDASAPNLSTNDWLRLGSTFHGLHAIAAQIAPVKSKGIEKLETDDFTLQCFQTLTGTCINMCDIFAFIIYNHIAISHLLSSSSSSSSSSSPSSSSSSAGSVQESSSLSHRLRVLTMLAIICKVYMKYMSTTS